MKTLMLASVETQGVVLRVNAEQPRYLRFPLDSDKALTVGSAACADVHVPGAPHVLFYLERQGAQIWLVPTQRCEALLVDKVTPFGPFPILRHVVVEFGTLRFEVAPSSNGPEPRLTHPPTPGQPPRANLTDRGTMIIPSMSLSSNAMPTSPAGEATAAAVEIRPVRSVAIDTVLKLSTATACDIACPDTVIDAVARQEPAPANEPPSRPAGEPQGDLPEFVDTCAPAQSRFWHAAPTPRRVALVLCALAALSSIAFVATALAISRGSRTATTARPESVAAKAKPSAALKSTKTPSFLPSASQTVPQKPAPKVTSPPLDAQTAESKLESADPLVQSAVDHLTAGRLAEAKNAYRALAQRYPNRKVFEVVFDSLGTSAKRPPP